ncbi:expressed unknown protein [Seminavis robusta]|uniref:Uncharacterized protein n=1 Tax=Seminavis robusta TaxID=568900 RepID=A0A9N8EXM1_9STRA|nr:expressed unknown protein [Seminavis robusta]|eukprot:Sro1911_g304930.1 n/a (444) ;mRNA; r:1665-3068
MADIGSDNLPSLATSSPPDTDNDPTKGTQDVKPNRYSSNLIARQQRIHAFKVGLGVLISLQFVLIEPVDTYFQQTGVWAVITTAIVILPTPGETNQKMINRTIGTVVAAALSILLGIACSELSNVLYPLGHILNAMVNFAVCVAGTYMADKGGTWSYAYLLGFITFVFLSASILVDDDVWVGVFRAVMIGIGGIIGLLVSWLPPTLSATALAKAYLADAILDTSLAAEAVMETFFKGRKLIPIHLITEPEDDDAFHILSVAVQVSRVPLEAALQASAFEGTRDSQVKSMRLSGLAVRLTLRSLLAADVLLRQDYQPLDPSVPAEAQLTLSLKEVVSSIHATMLSHEMVDFNALTVSVDKEQSCSVSDMPLSEALIQLETSLAEYALVRTENRCNGECQTMQSFACHVAFARNIHDAGSHFLQVLPHLLAGDIGSTSHGSSLDL